MLKTYNILWWCCSEYSSEKIQRYICQSAFFPEVLIGVFSCYPVSDPQAWICLVLVHPVLTSVTSVKFHYLCGWRMGVVLPSWFLKGCGMGDCSMGLDSGGGEDTARGLVKETAQKVCPNEQTDHETTRFGLILPKNLSVLYVSSDWLMLVNSIQVNYKKHR